MQGYARIINVVEGVVIQLTDIYSKKIFKKLLTAARWHGKLE